MDQRKLDLAKVTLGADTETAAVDAALDLVVFCTNVVVDALRQPPVSTRRLEIPERGSLRF